MKKDSDKSGPIGPEKAPVLPANEGQIRPLLTCLNHDGERLKVWAVLAEFEKEQIGERTRMALAHKKANGEAYCGAPFGFDAIAGRLVAVKKESAIVADILKLRESGASLADIANSLNDKGIEGKRGGKWFPSTVRYLIQRQAA